MIAAQDQARPCAALRAKGSRDAAMREPLRGDPPAAPWAHAPDHGTTGPRRRRAAGDLRGRAPRVRGVQGRVGADHVALPDRGARVPPRRRPWERRRGLAGRRRPRTPDFHGVWSHFREPVPSATRAGRPPGRRTVIARRGSWRPSPRCRPSSGRSSRWRRWTGSRGPRWWRSSGSPWSPWAPWTRGFTRPVSA
jgi:hypothetical protein